MKKRLHISILPQPDNITCGPTCLHGVYQYYGDRVALQTVIDEVTSLDEGGTMAVFLGCHALGRGFKAEIYTYNLQIFDPTWFRGHGQAQDLAERLRAQAAAKKGNQKLQLATQGYLDFLERGGVIHFQDLNTSLLKKFLGVGVPVLTGLSSTYLYRAVREYGRQCIEDDVRGEPVGHFVVICGYDKRSKRILVADPWRQNPISGDEYYHVGVNRLINAILLGVVTYDANLLIIQR